MPDIYGSRVNTTTQSSYIPKLVDTVLNSNILLERLLRAAKKWPGGRTVRVPIKVAKNTNFGSFRGLDTFSTNLTDNRKFLEYDPSFLHQDINLPGDEMTINANAGKNQVLNLVEVTMASDAQDMMDQFGDMIYGDGTGNSGKDVLGLAALVDDGTNVATIGGLSRATYPLLSSTVTASGGTLSIAKMDTIWYQATSGSVAPTIIVGSPTVVSLFEQLLRPMERIYKPTSRVKGLSLSTGVQSQQEYLQYRGVPVIADEKVPTGVMYFLNEKFLDMYVFERMDGLTPVKYSAVIDGNDYGAPTGLGFHTEDEWLVPQNAYGRTRHIYWAGQLTTSNPRRHAKLTGITTV